MFFGQSILQPQKKKKQRESAAHAKRREQAAFRQLKPADPAVDTWRPRDSFRRRLKAASPKQRPRRPSNEPARTIRGW